MTRKKTNLRKKRLTAKKTEILASHSFFHPGGTIAGVLFFVKTLNCHGALFLLAKQVKGG